MDEQRKLAIERLVAAAVVVDCLTLVSEERATGFECKSLEIPLSVHGMSR
jgi:hypothetical protein